jgi:hypothetical protein
MDYQLIYEWIGYTGSVIIAISLMMNSIIKLRWLNLLGASIFSAYGFIIGAMPVAFLNLFIALVNIYFLFKIHSKKDFFTIVQIPPDNSYLKYIIEFHKKDVNYFFPGFLDFFNNNSCKKDDCICFFLLTHAKVAGVFVGKKSSLKSNSNLNNELNIEMDFALPEYRDFKLGKYLYSQNQSFFKDLGIKKLSTSAKNNKHFLYLKKMGFEEEKRENSIILVKEFN